jgi:polyphosphate kinase 2 (PPK2 family)
MLQNVVVKSPIQLKDHDPAEDFGLKKEKTRQATRRLLERIGGLQAKLYANTRRSVLVVLQGMDASGKDGASQTSRWRLTVIWAICLEDTNIKDTVKNP